jgi:hypothetical protein
MVHRLALVLFPLLAACSVVDNVPVLEPEGKKIKLVRESDKPINCENLADVAGKARAGDEKEAIKGAENQMRNEAAQYPSANFAVVEVESVRDGRAGGGKEVLLSGQALKCITMEMEVAQEKAAAEAKEKEEQEAAEREREEELERQKEEAEAAEKKDDE